MCTCACLWVWCSCVDACPVCVRVCVPVRKCISLHVVRAGTHTCVFGKNEFWGLESLNSHVSWECQSCKRKSWIKHFLLWKFGDTAALFFLEVLYNYWLWVPQYEPRDGSSRFFYKQSWWLRWWRICPQCRKPRFDPWVGKIPWRRERLPAPVFLPGEFHGQRSLVSYSLWGLKELDMTEQLNTFTYIIIKKSKKTLIFCPTWLTLLV